MYQPSLFAPAQTRIVPPRSIWKLRKRGIYLGTSGYSYDDWVGPFYPEDTRKPQMLEYYQHFFPAVELNYTYYTLPRPSTLFQIRNKAPNMMFTVKAHHSMTHERRAQREDWREFADALLVLADTNQLAAVLFQFPSSFRCSAQAYEYLDEIAEYFASFRIVLELRHPDWQQSTVREYARRRKLTLCSLDAPRLPGLVCDAVFPDRRLAYYRLHGRNAATWFDGDNVTRYDYRYSDDELRVIVRNILSLLEQSDHVYLFANNHPRAQAIETVAAIAAALDRQAPLASL